MRRRRLVAAAGVVVVAALVAWLVVPGQGHKASHRAAAQPPRSVPAQVRKTVVAMPAIEAGLLPWKLTSPLSRIVVLAGSGSQLVVAGGLTESQATTSKVFTLDTATGALVNAGAMASGVHDGAGAVVAGQDVIFGGGSPNTVGGVQALAGAASPASGGTAATPAGAAQQIGSLPQPRSDHVVATTGSTAYVLGGYDGTAPDPQVLATTDGKSFQVVASLATPVRYPAAAALAGAIYLFGGQTIGAANAPTDVIQKVDPATHRATVVGHLPVPLEAAAAFSIGGVIYIAGGDSPAPPPTVIGAGTTQLNGWATGVGQPTPGLSTVRTVWAYDPATGRLLSAGQLQVPVSHAGIAVTGGKAWVVGGESDGRVLATVQVVAPNPSFGAAGAPGAGSPFYGNNLLVADRGNNRLLVMDPALNVVWTYPSSTSPPDPLGFFFPDDAFFVNHGTAIISNQEDNNTIVEIAYPSG
ncbi:MAG: hypothetical protein M3R71_05060, partial [Actinomycetota bacterium]|nr:hypothetical protein [Actinomycetota bacterium]